MHDSNNINNAIGFKASIALISLTMAQGQNMWIVGMKIQQELKTIAHFVNDLSSAQTMVPFPHSQSFTKVLNEVVATSTTS